MIPDALVPVARRASNLDLMRVGICMTSLDIFIVPSSSYEIAYS